MLLASCGGDRATAPQADTEPVATGAATAGPTPFISFVPFSGAGLANVVSYRYVISAKPGALSTPVDVTYTAAALTRRGHYQAGASAARLPVFGLYAGYLNQVALDLTFADGSHRQLAVTISTPPYVDPSGVFDKPNIIQKRTAHSVLGFSYFVMKSAFAGTIIADTDGEIRWTPAAAPTDAFSSTFDVDSFVLGSQTSADFKRLELDGSVSNTVLSPSPSASTYNRFHHNLDRGKVGLLGEVDGVVGGLPSVESVLVEFDRSGVIGKEWDFADILGRYMRRQGDDPSPFIRPG
ncbi:MAG: aryl-sulfate sulfotransferase, partial [Massilia sp.]|nr:aryl-sulfate sulfotransferase [Massilia sp.]